MRESVIEGQVSIFDLPEIIKRVKFEPKEVWQANFFNKFEIGKEYDVVKMYENRCGTKFYKLYGMESEAWCDLFEDIK